MTQPKTILTAARDIRPHLATLLDQETAQQVDRQLQTLLAQAESGQDSEQSVELPIAEVLRHSEPTQEWMRRYLKGENPEQITRSLRGYAGLAGDPSLQSARKYVCPHNDYTWYREDNSSIPLCPNHLIDLIPTQP